MVKSDLMCFRKFSMQISVTITEQCISIYTSVNITDHDTSFEGHANSMQISSTITEKLVSLHMSPNRPIFDN